MNEGNMTHIAVKHLGYAIDMGHTRCIFEPLDAVIASEAASMDENALGLDRDARFRGQNRLTAFRTPWRRRFRIRIALPFSSVIFVEIKMDGTST